jgi:hypothetical protein
MIRGVESNRLVNLLMTFYRPNLITKQTFKLFGRIINLPNKKKQEEE